MDTLFGLASLIVLPSWLALIVLPFRWPDITRVTHYLIPGLLGVAYLVLMLNNWGSNDGGYGSLAEVRELFSSDGLLLAGWFHYLAFDLFIGSWQVERAHRLGIPHGWVVPCLPLTFLFGPVGLLLYFLVESLWRVRTARREALA